MCARIIFVSRHVVTNEGGFQAAGTDDRRFHLIQGDTPMGVGDFIPYEPAPRWNVLSFETLVELSQKWNEWIATLDEHDDPSSADLMEAAMEEFIRMKRVNRRPPEIDRFGF
jgi:hypothetical protein